MVSTSKRENGQFFTTENPFDHPAFHAWLRQVPSVDTQTFLEPFAGACNLINMLTSLGYKNQWAAFDIEPVNSEANTSGVPVLTRNTLEDYPQGYAVAITNPPYLARNSASRRDLAFPDTDYDDLYQEALRVMLENTPYVAAIIPESFLTQGLFFSRVHAVISLTCKMFEETEVPVCLALFSPTPAPTSQPDSEQPETEVKPDANFLGKSGTKDKGESTPKLAIQRGVRQDPSYDFSVYDGKTLLGQYSKLKALRATFNKPGLTLKFNDPQGDLGLHAIDSNKMASIKFIPGEQIESALIKVSSRSLTRIKSSVPLDKREALLAEANRLLSIERQTTHDVFMTSFKGLRKDGKYRRRLDFAQARTLLNLAADNLGLLSPLKD